MNILKYISAVLGGAVGGSLVNMALLAVGTRLIPAPEGVDASNLESLRESIHLLGFKHYAVPFVAHAVGTYAGALGGWLLAPDRRDSIAWFIGFFFLAGGVSAAYMIPAPKAFIVADLMLAYLPTAWLAIRTGTAIQRRRT